MTLREAAEILNAEVITGSGYLDREISSLCGSDMMSEVLAFTNEHAVLLTGLCNPQVFRTAEMLDLMCIIFIRGKMPTEEMLEMANQQHIVVMRTAGGMFNSCGKLYAAGATNGCM